MILAVHLADEAVVWTWAAGGWVVAAGLVFAFARRVPDDAVPRVALVTAALFVASSVPVRVGVASVHPLLNGLAAVLLGRRAVPAVVVALSLQLLLLGHGGLSTFGLNVCVYAVPALAAAGCRPRGFIGGATVGGLTAAGSVLLDAVVLWLGGTAGVERLVPLVLVANLPVVAAEAVVCGFALRAVRLAQAGNTSGNGVSH